jgi:DNA/RNA-binding protein KIN17
MNVTKWPNLTEFAKFLGREGICRVEEEERGLFVSWIDNSPENLRRQDKGDEEREQMLIRQQVARARAEAGEKVDDVSDGERELKRDGGEKIKLSFGARPAAAKLEAPKVETATQKPDSAILAEDMTQNGDSEAPSDKATEPTEMPAPGPAAPAKVTMKMSLSSKPKNVFSAAKKAFVADSQRR